MPKYQCAQLGRQCPRAQTGEEFEIKPGASFQCALSSPDPQCREKLLEVRGRKLSPKLKLALVAVPVAVLGVGAWFFLGAGPNSSPKTGVEQLLIEVWPWLKNTP
jgi:hypothetical protein